MVQASQARQLFDEALILPAEDRERFIAGHCSDPSVRDLVRRLLAAHGEETDFLLRTPVPACEPASGIAAGKRIGPYTIESEVGRGGMGTVYRAVRSDDAYRKTVAVKVVSGSVSADLFRRERQIMASLEHANIARLMDGGASEDGSPYLVMEFIEGERIDEWAAARDLSTRDRLRLVLSVCDGIAYAHRHLVVHGDLKPANVLVTADGIAKLLDFGIARVLAPETGAAHTLCPALTPEYASPEQIRGEPVTTASDVYSFGILLFELLTGGRPFIATSGSLPARLRAALEAEPRRPSTCAAGRLRRELRGDLDKIVLKAIAREPERRYASTLDLRSDIEAWLAGRPVRAQGDRFAYRARKFVRRYWLPLGAAAAVLLSSSLATIAVARQAGIAEQRRLVAEAAARRVEDLLVNRQRLLAEQITLRSRAEAEARRAQSEHALAAARLRHARELAGALLFDIHDAVRDLNGATEARRRIVDSAVGQLEALSKDAPEDLKLQGVLAAAYERAGDLVGGISGEGTDGTSAGLEFYRKSLAIQQRLARDAGLTAQPETWSRLANAWRRVGIVEYRAGDLKAAASSLVQALRSLEAGQSRGGRWPEIDTKIHHDLCNFAVLAGERQIAPAACRAAIVKMRQSVSAEFTAAESRYARAVNFQRLAQMTYGAGDILPALELLNAGIQEQASLAREYPDNAAYRRSLAAMLGYLARWRDRIGGPDALAAYAQALESFQAARTVDARQTMLAMLHAWSAMRYAGALHRAGRDAHARLAARESIQVFEELIGAPKAGFMEFNDYANELAKCPFPDLCDAQKALKHAQTAVAMTNRENAFALDTLANAWFRAGEFEKAVDTQRRALSLSANLPAGAREEIQAALHRFEAERVRQATAK